MITTIEEFQKHYNDRIDEFINKVQNGDKTFPTVYQCITLDKPMLIYTNNREAFTDIAVDKGDHYIINFPRFNQLQKEYTNDLAWVLDSDTVFFLERPYKNKVVSLLRKLLPNNNVHHLKNDVIIDNVKIGPTLTTGTIENYHEGSNSQNSGIIYCLRWSNLEGLDKVFKGNKNHEERKNNMTKSQMGTLNMFLTNTTKTEFEKMLEEEI